MESETRKTECFEDLVAWQKARQVVKEIYALARRPPLRADPALADQMRRAAVSILANIAEGFERRSRAEFARFLMIAAGSAGELRAHLYVVEDVMNAESDAIAELRRAVQELSRIIAGLRRSVIQRMQATGK